MKYYIRSNGKMYGPVEENKIRARVLSGFFSENSLVSTDLKEWGSLQQYIPVMRSAVAREENEPGDPVQGTPHIRLSSDNIIRPQAVPEASPPHPPRSQSVLILALCVLVLLILCGVGAYFLFTKFPIMQHHSGTASNFQEVCKQYQSAIGLVVVTLENSDGELLSGNIGNFKVKSDHPIATAFAIDKNKFATNCHVAYGIKNQKNGVLNQILEQILREAARESGVKTPYELQQFRKKNEKEIEEFRKYLHANIRIRNVEIRLAHTGGRSLTITGVQIHPRYQTDPDDDHAFKNGEFDVAILTTSESVEKFCKIASPKRLHALAQGQEIAYIGFPMEGLIDNGNLDFDRPEAIFKSGTISKITDFNNVFSSPELNKSIIHDIPAAGGASGSPIFLPDGQVIAILWGVTHTGQNQRGRIPSAIQHNMAVRIDSLDIVGKQKIYDLQDWLGEAQK
ncbi:MAG: trypsin-like peptidase domain-containing protein [Lentisphaeria bacterium]|nr:trypsin-like peptidase domain-containing protein [Lentisphaeria bacterium]